MFRTWTAPGAFEFAFREAKSAAGPSTRGSELGELGELGDGPRLELHQRPALPEVEARCTSFKQWESMS